MKSKINSLNDALAFLLQGLYFTETKIRDEFPACCADIDSARVRNEIHAYTINAENNLLKLERIFNYLLKEPLVRTNEVINGLMNETQQMLASTGSPHLKDILSIGCVQNISAYKISTYRSAYIIAVELELDTATDLLQQILEWELETNKALAALSIEEFNKAQQPAVH